MIFLYAVDPELAADWKSLRFVLSHGGVEHARLLLKYPKRWLKDAMLYARKEGLLNGKRVEELCRRRGSCFVRPSVGLDYDPKRTWLDNALAIGGHATPQAIIIPVGKSHPDERVIDEEDLDEHDLWLVESSVLLERHADAFEGAMKILMLCCRQLTIIEPHFSPASEKWRAVLVALLEPLRSINREVEIELHLKGDADVGWFQETCEKQLSHRVPQGLSVKFVRWNERSGQERLHDRHLMTELGGVTAGFGFDEGRGSTTSVHTFNVQHRERLKAQFSKNGGSFDYSDEYILHGTG